MKTKTSPKDLEVYLATRYPITLMPAREGIYGAEIKDLPGCVAQGETVQEVLDGIEEVRQLWIESAYELGKPIPPPSSELEYSGRILVRMPRSLHMRLTEHASRDGISLNQYILTLLSQNDASHDFVSLFTEQAHQAQEELMQKISQCCIPQDKVDLRHLDLRGLDLSNRHLTGLDLRGAKLVETNLTNSDLSGSDLSGADLSGANLSGVILNGTKLDRADLTGADLSLVSYDTKSKFGSPPSFRDAKLLRAKLCKAELDGVNFMYANLSDADLSKASLHGSPFKSAKLCRANLEGADLRSGHSSRVNLERAILKGAELEEAFLDNSNLRGANLEGANLKDADLQGADLSGVDYEGANFKGATLKNAKGLSEDSKLYLKNQGAVLV